MASFTENLIQIWRRRPDLQAVYNPDGSKRNPNDGNPPTLLDWAQQFGVSEEPELASTIAPFMQARLEEQQGFQPTAPQEPTILDIAQEALKALEQKGLTINPKVEVTPEKLAEFLKFAEDEVNPGYQTKLRVSREKLLRNIGYDTETIQQFEAEQERKYGKEVRKLGENYAEQGFALSGRRVRDERELAEGTQRTLDEKRRQLDFETGNEVIGQIENYGSRNLPNIPQIGETPRVLPGQGTFQRSGNQRPLYSLSPGLMDNIVGEQEKQKSLGVRSLAQEYEGLYRQGRTLPRELNI